MIYVFDVDKTLAPSYNMMQEDMAELFREWMQGKKVFLASGAQLEKMKAQVPLDIMDNVTGLFPQMACELYLNGELKYQRQFEWPEGMREQLEGYIANSPYPVKVGDHIQERGSMVNYSIAGKNSNQEQRDAYTAWDDVHGERERIAAELREQYPQLSILVGGQISMDISMHGHDKSQALAALRELYGDEPITFMGDKMMEGGNDYPLAKVLREEAEEKGIENQAIMVQDPEHTASILKEMLEKEKAV